MVPTVVFPAVMPFTCQVTEVLLLLSTVAVNFCVLPAAKEAEGGEIVTLTGETVRVTLADADLVVSALEIAFTVITRSLETLAGATYSPEVEMVPLLEFPPVVPLTCQVTAVLEVFSTVAVNCWVPAAGSDVVVGETETLTAANAAT